MYKMALIDPSGTGFDDWASTQSGIQIINVQFVDASSLYVFYNETYIPTTRTTGSRVEDQPNGKGVGYNG